MIYLLGGQLVEPKTVQGMVDRLYPMFGQPQFYGRGVMLYEVPKPDGGTEVWLGHSGGCPGIKAVVAYLGKRPVVRAHDEQIGQKLAAIYCRPSSPRLSQTDAFRATDFR